MQTNDYYRAAGILERALDGMPIPSNRPVSDDEIVEWLYYKAHYAHHVKLPDILHFVETYPWLPNKDVGIHKPTAWKEPKVWSE
jgi:hypothetical protein